MSEPNQIWDGSSYGDSDERQAWEELNEACASDGDEQEPKPAFGSFDWVKAHVGQGIARPELCEHIEKDEQGYCLNCGAYLP